MKTILFDLDGTLTDPALGITNAVQHALHYYDIEETYDNLLKFIGPPLVDCFMEMYDFNKKKAEQAVVYYREYFSVTGLFENKVYPEMENFLNQLKQDGYQLAVATSKPEIFANQIMDHFNLSQYFTAIYGATLDGKISRKADVIAYALQELNIEDKNKVIMVGDRQHDIIGAHENHIKAIGVLYGYGNIDEMKEYQADWIVDNLKQLYQTIKEVY